MRRVIACLCIGLLGCTAPSVLDAGADAPSVDAPAMLDAPLDPDAPLDAATDGGASDAGLGRIDAILALLNASPRDEGEIAAALHDVAWDEGWPLHEGTRWLFVTDAIGSSVNLVSDVNAWSTTAHPAEQRGAHAYVLIEDAAFVVPAAGSQYKWWVDGAYLPPLEATAYGFDGFGRFGWVAPDPSAPHLEQFPDFVGAHLAAPRTFRAYLPAGFVARSSAATTMRTLLVHDGQNVFDPTAAFGGWRLDEALAAHPDVVALAIDNAPDRIDAYTHVEDDIGSVVGGRADAYLALVFDEALPFFRARYGVSAEGDGLALMGSSLGGLVTVYAALHAPTRFGCGAALSPTMGWGSFRVGARDALVTRWASDVGHGAVSLYLDSGGGVMGACVDSDLDGVEDDGDDADNYCVTSQFRDVLDGLGYDFGVDLAHWHEPGATHDEAAWAARAGRALAACSAMGWSR